MNRFKNFLMALIVVPSLVFPATSYAKTYWIYECQSIPHRAYAPWHERLPGDVYMYTYEWVFRTSTSDESFATAYRNKCHSWRSLTRPLGARCYFVADQQTQAQVYCSSENRGILAITP